MNTKAKMVLRAETLEKEFPVGSRWRHHSGRYYIDQGVANIAKWDPKYRPVIIFKSEVPTDGAILPSRLWTKTPAHFRRTMMQVID